jgi:hypothetical protein
MALLLVLVAAGCSTFNRDWKAAARSAPLADTIEGRWDGTWRSETNGHHGRLRCLITRRPDGDYDARFHANYNIILPLRYGYTVPLEVQETNGVFKFQGKAKLGWLAGGLYEYAGEVVTNRFFSTYKCQRDHGTFEMNCPQSAE